MRLFVLSSLLLAFFLSGCATNHPGQISEGSDKTLTISIDRNDNLSDKFYIFYEYTLENKSSAWKDVQIISVTFDGETTEALIGDQLEAWIEGAEHKLKASQYNQQLMLASMAAVGGVAAATSSNSNVQGAGIAVMSAGVGVEGATQISRGQDKANSGIRGQNGTVNVPKTHVFVPSKIAPESYIRRWIVLKAPTSPSLPPKRTPGLNKIYNFHKLVSTLKVGPKNEVYSAVIKTTHR